jgi:hypothetical protein
MVYQNKLVPQCRSRPRSQARLCPQTAINGGSPQLVLIDEIGNIGILGAMLNEGRPTMFWNNPVTGEFEMKRQLFMWSTGGEMDKGKGDYEKEWHRILHLWEQKKYRESGIIPLFFSWHVRFDKRGYESEKQWYYGGRAEDEDIDIETSKTQFHQHYPTSFRDMFLKTSNTLVSRHIIEEGEERCRNLDAKLKPVWGYFEPVYDFNDPMPPESDTPFRVIDATFVAINDDEMGKATALMFQRPEAGWTWRYYQGTDPIATESGHSKMSSVIWDEYYRTIPCAVNYRKQQDHKKSFLQVFLMGLYYDTRKGKKEGVKELVEANIGTNYIDYKSFKGYINSLVYNSELPDKVSGGARDIGIDTKGVRSDGIIDYMAELFRTYYRRIFIHIVFTQLRTFVQAITRSGRETWGPMNKSLHFDDLLYASTFAYICRMCFPHQKPTRQEALSNRFSIKMKLVRDPHSGMLERKAVRVYEKSTVENEIPDLDALV